MKKSILMIFTAILIILCFIYYKYIELKNKSIEIKQFNAEYEIYLNKEIKGNDLTSVINKAVNNNEKNKINKDTNGFYIPNDENSISVEIKITDLEKDEIIKMEQFYQNNMLKFLNYYDNIKFECTDIKYNTQKKVNYLLFEQISH